MIIGLQLGLHVHRHPHLQQSRSTSPKSYHLHRVVSSDVTVGTSGSSSSSNVTSLSILYVPSLFYHLFGMWWLVMFAKQLFHKRVDFYRCRCYDNGNKLEFKWISGSINLKIKLSMLCHCL